MEDQRFWEIVDRFQWGNPDVTDGQREKIKRDLLYTLSLKELEDLRDTYYEKVGQINEASGVDYCFDGWTDCKAHIVGLGKKEFLRNLGTPKLILERLESDDYRECFAYVIPHPGDIVRLTHFFYERFSVEYSRDLEEIFEDEDLSEKVKDRARRVSEILEMLGGMEYQRGVDMYYAEFPEDNTDEFWWKHLHHGVPNLVHDVQRYML